MGRKGDGAIRVGHGAAMRLGVLPLIALLAACGAQDDAPRPVSAADVMRAEPAAAAVWPALLRHCLRNPLCDPLSDFGLGAGSASGVERQTSWLAERAANGSATIRLAFAAPRGRGGEAGRPLTQEETPASLRTARDRTSWLVVDHAVADGKATARRLVFRSAHLAMTVPGVREASSDKARQQLTADFLAAMTWPDGQRGVRVTLASPTQTLFASYSSGAPVAFVTAPPAGAPRTYVPWMFEIAHDASGETTRSLISALAAGETLTMRIQTPAGLVLEDAIYAAGYADAISRGLAALDDPAIAEPLTTRCAALASEPDAFWIAPDVSPARLGCDPRPPEKRHADERAAREGR